MKNMRQALLVAGCLLATTTLFAQTEKGDWAQFGRYAEANKTVKVPSNVVFMGINDIAHNNGVIALENVYGNLVSMAELAKVNNIKVIFCSVMPAYDFPWRPGMKPADKVIQLNKWIKEYADKNGLTYVDYHSAANLSKDGVHPTLEGYKIMEKIVLEAIHKTVK